MTDDTTGRIPVEMTVEGASPEDLAELWDLLEAIPGVEIREVRVEEREGDTR